MKIRRKQIEKVPLDMTPMIDVVFQLMAFFIMTFSVVTAEGDFNIKMPLAAGGPPVDSIENVPVTVRMEADASGQLARLRLGDRDLNGDFGQLRAEVLSLSSGSEDSGVVVELDSDYELDYRYTVDALTAVTGYRNRDGQIIRVLDNVRFAKPRK